MASQRRSILLMVWMVGVACSSQASETIRASGLYRVTADRVLLGAGGGDGPAAPARGTGTGTGTLTVSGTGQTQGCEIAA